VLAPFTGFGDGFGIGRAEGIGIVVEEGFQEVNDSGELIGVKTVR
jgi:hypothetical protein